MIKIMMILVSFVAGLGAITGLSEKQTSSNEPADSGVAVVELFTSQGCSSCPPADRVLSDLSEAFANDNKPVYLLSFHVDYWNNLGWDDPYSLEVSSRRQKAYAAAWGTRRVYTPQMVVNGEAEFNGGNRKMANAAIDESLSKKSKSSIKLTQTANERSVEISYEVSGLTEDSVLNIAIVSALEQNSVPAGENRGRTLDHVNVVRAFKVVSLDQDGSGTAELEVPADLEGGKLKIIAYTQLIDDAMITGASAIPVR